MAEKDPFLNRRIDEYKLEVLLGVGGMARVYRGVDTRLKRYVAVKVIGFPHQYDATYITRFEREAQVIAQFSHPNIVPLYRYGEIDGFLYMVMQYIDGSDLHSVLTSYRKDGEYMDPEDVLHILSDVCSALDYIHSKGIIHRDIKPSNILLDKEGRAFLSDFGLALIREVGTLGEIFGSPQYISPEQTLSSAKAESRSDIYSIGVILFEIFTGRLPFENTDPVEQALMHLNQPVPSPRSLRPEISPQVEAVIFKALAKKPEDRFDHGAALVKALSTALKYQAAAETGPPTTLSSLTIADRVRVQASSARLPDLVTPSDRQPFSTTTAASEKPVSRGRPKFIIPILAVAGLAGFLVFAFLCVWIAISGIRFGSQFLRSSDGPAVTNPVSAITQSPVTQPAVVTPNATGPSTSPADFQLQFIKKGQDSLYLVNVGESTLPLELIQIGNPPNYVPGSAWEPSNLQPGECVVLYTERAGENNLDEVECKLVGRRILVVEKKPFWSSEFSIYFNNNFADSCKPGRDDCEIRIPPSP